MTPAQRNNLKRLLSPKHIAVVGGRDAAIVVRECKRIGFKGTVWAVNPNRSSLEGLTCIANVTDLPQAPDAVFLAIPASEALGVVAELAAMGVGGVVCFTAGFGDDGQEGGISDQPLVDAAGDMAIVGPNCYGLINYIDQIALWPFEHAGYCPGYGAAVITQSGMLSSDITMNQRSLPLAFMISAGNQSVLQLEDYLEVLCEFDSVKAIGLHIEGIKNMAEFSKAALKALSYGKPIVVMKTGKSKIGSSLTVSHTGSLSGAYDCYQALFRRLGIIEVDHPAQLVETLKWLIISGIPAGNRLVAFTCSGGGATMVADHAEEIGLNLNAPSSAVAKELDSLLPDIATVSNPLDYTTPIWGQPEKTQPVFSAAMSDAHDVALLIQDYPLPAIDDSKHFYLKDALAFSQAAKQSDLPHAVCSTLSENMDRATRETLIQQGVTTLQGIQEGLDAIRAAVTYGGQLHLSRDHATRFINTLALTGAAIGNEVVIKQSLANAGMNVPSAHTVSVGSTEDELRGAAGKLTFPVVLKVVSPNIQHKSDVGAVAIGLESADAVVAAARVMQQRLSVQNLLEASDCYLLETQLPQPIVELFVSIRADDQFGLVMTLAAGGTLVELLDDSRTLILPVAQWEIADALDALKLSKLLKGYRGAPAVNVERLLSALTQLIDYAEQYADDLTELEINPLFVYSDEVVIIDALAHYRSQ